MLDRFGRPVTGLRISVTDECNLSCFYCHKLEESVSGSKRRMSAKEIGRVVGLAIEFGVKKIKLTGGEPLLRSDIIDLVAAIADQPIEEISMSTNGTLLADCAIELAEAGLDRVNISMDTLVPEIYTRITGRDLLPQTIAGIEAALEADLRPVKLNMVVLAGINEKEIERMISYAADHGIILQLIELIETPTNERVFARYHRDLDDVEKKLHERAKKIEVRPMHNRKKYILDKGEVEIVKPFHNSEFCSHCTRLRLTPDGFLKSCLMRNDHLVDLLTHVRAGDLESARKAFIKAIELREPYSKGYTFWITDQ